MAYKVMIDRVIGNDDVSIANALKQLREFRQQQQPPPPLPPKPGPIQKRSGRKK